MAVNLSPIWGAGAQLLDNSGNVLSGGKIYTYAAGTTTPATTYTSNNGSTANSNPIILNSAGRVPYEIWLSDGISYKFVLKDSNDTLIATYDNLIGINSNFVNFTNQQEIQTATAGQTVFTLVDVNYSPGTNSLTVFVDGVNQYGPGAQYAYVETDSTTVTFVTGLHVGASVKFTTSQLNSSTGVDAAQVSYTPPFTDSVATNVEAKLAQYVSVKDFGAVGDGITDDTTAIQAAFDSVESTGQILYFPSGTYLVTTVTQNQTSSAQYPVNIIGDGMGKTIVKKTGTSTDPVFGFTSTGALFGLYQTISNITIEGNNGGSDHSGLYFDTWAGLTASNVQVKKCYLGVQGLGLLSSTFNDCEIQLNGQGYRLEKSGSIYANAIKIIGGRIISNYQRGINFDYGSGLHLYGVNVELNGTSGNLNYGGIFIGGNVSAETGVSEFSFDGCWFEGNLGTTVKFETKITGTIDPVISFTNNVLFIGELVGGLGYGLIVDSGRQLTVADCVIAGLNAGSLTANVNYLDVKNSVISVLNNNANYYKVFGVTTYTGEVNVEMVGGTKTTDNAPAGFVGEYKESIIASASAISLSTGAWKTVTSIQLTPGDWDVSSTVGLALGSGTTVSYFASNISSATDNAGLDENRTQTLYQGAALVANPKQTNSTVRYSVGVNTNVYLTTAASFGVSTCAAYGKISARRVR